MYEMVFVVTSLEALRVTTSSCNHSSHHCPGSAEQRSDIDCPLLKSFVAIDSRSLSGDGIKILPSGDTDANGKCSISLD